MSGARRNKAYSAGVITLNASGVQTIDSSDLDGGYGKGLLVFINVTALAGTTKTLTVTVSGKDPYSGVYYTILASTAISATGFTVLRVFPGLTAAANATANDILPPDFKITAAVAGTGAVAVTATISAAVID